MSQTFEQVLDRFIEKCKARGREPATVKSYTYYRDRFLVPMLGSKLVTELHFRDLEQLYVDMVAAGYATSSVQKCHVTAGGALKLALREEWVTKNVATMAELPKHIKPKLIVPSPADVATFLALAARIDPAIHDFARIGAATGLRPGENCALMVSDLDANDTLTIQRALDVCQGTARIKTTKTDNVRLVTLDVGTASIIRSKPGPFVHGGDEPMRTDLVSKRFKRIAIRAGVPNLKAKMLRHFHATQLLASRKLSDKQIAERLGHKNPLMLNTVYGHALPALDVVASDVIAAVLPPVEAVS